MANIPQKSDTEAIFHRLRALPTNKTCFDCNSKNPTWASVTYGVFICIDCSAVHRSLGVHLTFVRSTNLDTNWTWIQVRQMQLGGNANASQFFRQHNCNTSDAQQKYNSRAAQLYRDKLATAAQQAMKTHGTALYLDSTADLNDDANGKKEDEEDFFAECNNDNIDPFNENNVSNNNYEAPTLAVKTVPKVQAVDGDAGGAPSVDFLNYTEPIEVKSTIGVRKIQPKRGLAAGKKGGLGATKVKTNFADLEQRANMADQQKFSIPEKKQTAAEEEETIASVRLAYQDLSVQAHKQEEKLKQIDPAKAKQMERLGMGFNVKSGVSHSALSDMKTLTQDEAPSKFSSNKSSSSAYEKEAKDDMFFFDYSKSIPSKQDRELEMMGFETIEPIESNTNISSMFSPSSDALSSSSTSSKYIHDQPSSFSETNRNRGSTAKQTPGGTKYNTYDNDSAQKKFGAAKAISSDQFFNNEVSSFERSANLAKFQGSSSISSAEYFGEGTDRTTRSGKSTHYNGPDLEDVRESVRHGVTRVAGRLSSLATDMMSSLQDKYGG